MNLRPPGYEPGELPDCSTPRRMADCSSVVTIIQVDWTIYGALAAGFFAIAGAAVFVVVRSLQSWRSLKRFRRRLGRELDRLDELTERASETAARASDQAELEQSLARLRVSLAQFEVLRSAFEDATDTFDRFIAFYPRK